MSARTAPAENGLEVRAGLGAGPAVRALELVRPVPPSSPEPITDGARISGPWRFGPFDCHVPGPDDHVLVTTLSAEGKGHLENARPDASCVPDARRLHPRPLRSRRSLAGTGSGICRAVFLGPARLKRCAEEVGRGRESELLERLQ